MTTKSRLTRAAAIVAAALTALMMAPTTASAQNDLGFGFGIQVGPDGKPKVSIGIGNRPQVPDEVCFYERTRLRGDSFCLEPGSSLRNLGEWADNIGSFDNPSGVRVTLCTRTNFRGQCRTYRSGANSVGPFDGNVGSIQVRRN